MEDLSLEMKAVEKSLEEQIKFLRDSKDIDPYIRNELIELNKIGFLTLFSCSGHSDDSYPYIYGIVSNNFYKRCIEFMDTEKSKFLQVDVFSRHNKEHKSYAESKESPLYVIGEHLLDKHMGRFMSLRWASFPVEIGTEYNVYGRRFYYEEDDVLGDGDDLIWMYIYKNVLKDTIEFIKKRSQNDK